MSRTGEYRSCPFPNTSELLLDFIQNKDAEPTRQVEEFGRDRFGMTYADMTDDQVQYYLGWRQRVRNHDPTVPARIGLIGLRICEGLHLSMWSKLAFRTAGEDPDAALMEELEWMFDTFGDDYEARIVLSNVLKDLSIATGRPMDGGYRWTGRHLMDIVFSTVVSSDSPTDIPLGAISELAGMPELNRVPDADTFTALFNDCLSAISRHERRKGVKSRYFSERHYISKNTELFSEYPEGVRQTYVIAGLDLRGGGLWCELLQGLAGYICGKLFWDWKDVPWQKAVLLPENLADVVDGVLSGNGDADPEDEVLPDILEECIEEVVLPEGFGDDFPTDPTVLDDPTANKRYPHRDKFLEDMESMAGASGTPGETYVPSGMYYASFDRMTSEQMEFYFSWKAEVLNGYYRDTDRGYLWLLLCDLVNGDMESDAVMGVLRGLYDAYVGNSSGYVRSLIGRTMADFGFMTGQDCVWYGNESDRELIIGHKIALEENGWFTVDLLNGYGSSDFGKYLVEEVDYDTVLNRTVQVLRRDHMDDMEAEYRVSGRDVTRCVHRRLFPDLIHNWQEYQDLIFPYVGPESVYHHGLRDAAKIAIRAVNKPSGARYNKTLRGRSLMRVADEMEKWFSEEEHRKEQERARDSIMSKRIDRDAVMDAERDLEVVKNLISMEDTVESIPEPVPEEEETPSGWTSFAKALSDTQRGYLEACIKGKGSRYLREVGASEVSMEDSINTISMDAVGDQIVESGTVFDEYLDELSSVL